MFILYRSVKSRQVKWERECGEEKSPCRTRFSRDAIQKFRIIQFARAQSVGEQKREEEKEALISRDQRQRKREREEGGERDRIGIDRGEKRRKGWKKERRGGGMQKWKSEQSRLLPMKQSKSEHVFNGGKKKKDRRGQISVKQQKSWNKYSRLIAYSFIS